MLKILSDGTLVAGTESILQTKVESTGKDFCHSFHHFSGSPSNSSDSLALYLTVSLFAWSRGVFVLAAGRLRRPQADK